MLAEKKLKVRQVPPKSGVLAGMLQRGSSDPYKSCIIQTLRPPRLRGGLCGRLCLQFTQILPKRAPSSKRLSNSRTKMTQKVRSKGGPRFRHLKKHKSVGWTKLSCWRNIYFHGHGSCLESFLSKLTVWLIQPLLVSGTILLEKPTSAQISTCSFQQK